MSIQWSDWVGKVFGRARIGLLVTWNEDAWTAHTYITMGATTGDEITITRSGNAGFAGSKTFTHKDPSGSVDTLVDTQSGTATPGQELTFTVAMSGNWKGFNPSLTVTSRAPYLAPEMATSLSVVAAGTTKAQVTWDLSPAADAPIQSQRLLRRRFGTTDWLPVGSIPNGATKTFTDPSIEMDRDYQYAVETRNVSPTESDAAKRTKTTLSTPLRAQTTPAPPVALTAVRRGADVELTVTPGSAMPTLYDLWRSDDDGATWSWVDTWASTSTTTIDYSPSVVDPNLYRIQAIVEDGITGLPSSPVVYSNVVIVSSPPAPPSSLSPNGVAVPADETTEITWIHNPLDTTDQEKFQIRHRKVGDAWTEESPVTSTASLWDLIADAYALGDEVEYQVRTWGSHADPSDWSSTAVLIMSARPSLVINAPSTSLTTSQIVVEWSYFSSAAAAQAAWRLRLSNGVPTIESLSGSGAAGTATFATPAGNGLTYTVWAEVQDADGLWSEVESSTFTVTYLPPAAVDLDVTFDRLTGRAYLETSPEEPVTEVTDTIAFIDVQRRLPGGDWETILTGAAADTYTFDPLPTTRGVNQYRIVAHSPLGAQDINPVVDLPVNETMYAYLNFGPQMSLVARMWDSVDLSSATSSEKDLVTLESSQYPVLLSGDGRSHSLGIRGNLDWLSGQSETVPSASLRETWEAAGLEAKACAWRDPTGRRMSLVGISTVQIGQDWDQYASVAFTLTRIAASV